MNPKAWVYLMPCFVLVLSGCPVKPLPPPLVETIAILPFDNESNNIDAPEIMQNLVYAAMVNSQYRVIDVEEINGKLKEMGITDGGQLPVLSAQKIAQDLGVQGLIYGNVESFGYTNIGIYVSRKVSIDLKLVEGTNEQTLWENSGTKANRKFGFDEQTIKENFTKGLVSQLSDKLLDNPLEEESKWAVRAALRTLPGYRFSGFVENLSGKDKTKKEINKNIQRNINSR